MKTIGLIGGMSWESSASYYRTINETVKEQLGGLHSAKCILYNVDFDEIERYQTEGDWNAAGRRLSDAARSLEKAGADFLVICTNTMHKVVNQIEERIHIPVLHIADATAKQIQQSGIKTVGLLGTRYTMEQDFYKERLTSQGINVMTPSEEDRKQINRIIFDELCLGKIEDDSREYYRSVIKKLSADGAQGIILGCTEIGLLISPGDTAIPLFDTAEIHALEAVKLALKES
ncbi:aspartate racemase [Jeotgalibacillus malaysiensis]|uniref:Aspartate racemase n=1 Tax=Jeotgalibacillus malaysiensis TaxID=1508404 RepID=A0A0B5AHX2_9BACL|nr:aspartate/glutamate racemase family protein [Jeotgalibacillus malaysiensis]AJD89671.1 aspartate racemase [Jeotgalibacillus malaysiensis]